MSGVMCEKTGQVLLITHRKDMRTLPFMITLIFTVGLSVGRRVSLPAGPLIRVEGEALSLRCEVSDYQGPKEQEFEWKATKGSETIQVVSTFDSSFPDQSLKARVSTDDISVKRIDESTVELRIKEARVTDSGTFTCSTLSTDSVISGNYEADVLLRVIPNTLAVVPEVPAPSVHEGRFINLHCNITQNFTEGIYLSVTWSVKKDQSLEQDLLTFGPDSGLTVGKNFIQRYADGEMHLHMDNTGSYSLVLSGAVPADQGVYVCTVKQWTREQGTWNRIQEKAKVIGQVAVITTAESLTVQVLDSTIFNTGDNLNLTCLVSADDLAALGLEVTWLLNDTQVLTHLSRDGVVAKTSDMFSINRVGEGEFRLEIHSIELSDMGLYSCRVRAWIQQSWGKWYQAAEKTSAPVQVVITPKGPVIGVIARHNRQATFSGSTFEMNCLAKLKNLSESVALSVIILVQYGVGAPTRKLASLSPDLVLKLEDWHESSRQNGLSLVKTGNTEFLFRIQSVQMMDRGFYSCEVAAWTRPDGNNWVEITKGESNKIQINFEHTSPSFDLLISSDTTSVYPWETVKIDCNIGVSGTSNTDNVAYEIRWYQSHLRESDNFVLLASVDRWGVVRKSIRNDTSDCSLERLGTQRFVLTIHGTQDSDAGEYYCTATPWIRSTTTADWRKEPEIRSKRAFLNVKFALWDSMKLPLLYGTCTSLSVGLFSVILGLLVSLCCCRNKSGTDLIRHSTHRLIDMHNLHEAEACLSLHQSNNVTK
ncbi:prostaglandin F2 receptor negative regulator isoform X2 [Ictalurus punctatus]|uniref:Prostaglandin F2 receptor negative regulator isoform X2 n=1 Tax=Ictalurus punctatus TaxID=7998 RepID=A0A2D0Q0R0_ICTPU|nr:prostaglandin F2 receptor negative regulator isoform X2 [Ictalurus punctatus]